MEVYKVHKAGQDKFFVDLILIKALNYSFSVRWRNSRRNSQFRCYLDNFRIFLVKGVFTWFVRV